MSVEVLYGFLGYSSNDTKEDKLASWWIDLLCGGPVWMLGLGLLQNDLPK